MVESFRAFLLGPDAYLISRWLSDPANLAVVIGAYYTAVILLYATFESRPRFRLSCWAFLFPAPVAISVVAMIAEGKPVILVALLLASLALYALGCYKFRSENFRNRAIR